MELLEVPISQMILREQFANLEDEVEHPIVIHKNKLDWITSLV
jgi:hypothetical protein